MPRHKTGSKSSRRKRRKPPIPFKDNAENLAINTSVGNILINSNASIYVSLGNGRYVKKPAGELQAGEMVLFCKEGIELDLERDVEPILLQSPRYAATLPQLFVEGRDGYRTTRFAHTLCAGLECFGEPPANEREAAELVSAMLEVHGLRRSLAQIRQNWLCGKTVAPNDFQDIFSALGQEMPYTEFAALAKSEDFSGSYRLHRILRVSVMRALSLVIRGSGDGTAKDRRKDHESLDTRPELKLVTEHFAEDVDCTYANIRIFDVRPVPEEAGGEKKEHAALYKGMVNRPLPQFDAAVEDLKSIELDRSVVFMVIRRVVDEYLFENFMEFGHLFVMMRDICRKATESLSAKYGIKHPGLTSVEHLESAGAFILPNRSVFLESIIDRIRLRLGYEAVEEKLRRIAMRRKLAIRTLPFALHFTRRDMEVYSSTIDAVSEKVARELEGGALDRKHGLVHGTLFHAMECENRLLVATPELLRYYLFLLKNDVFGALVLRNKSARAVKEVLRKFGHPYKYIHELVRINKEVARVKSEFSREYGIDLEQGFEDVKSPYFFWRLIADEKTELLETMYHRGAVDYRVFEEAAFLMYYNYFHKKWVPRRFSKLLEEGSEPLEAGMKIVREIFEIAIENIRKGKLIGDSDFFRKRVDPEWRAKAMAVFERNGLVDCALLYPGLVDDKDS